MSSIENLEAGAQQCRTPLFLKWHSILNEEVIKVWMFESFNTISMEWPSNSRSDTLEVELRWIYIEIHAMLLFYDYILCFAQEIHWSPSFVHWFSRAQSSGSEHNLQLMLSQALLIPKQYWESVGSSETNSIVVQTSLYIK